jgi:hypothetical protein
MIQTKSYFNISNNNCSNNYYYNINEYYDKKKIKKLTNEIKYNNKIIFNFYTRIKEKDSTVISDINKLFSSIEKEDRNKCNLLYNELNILTQTFDYQYLYNDINTTLLSTQQRLIDAEKNSCNINNKSFVDSVVNTVQVTVIKFEYLKYIQIYGFPDDGIFLPSLLDKIINENNYNSDTSSSYNSNENSNISTSRDNTSHDNSSHDNCSHDNSSHDNSSHDNSSHCDTISYHDNSNDCDSMSQHSN